MKTENGGFEYLKEVLDIILRAYGYTPLITRAIGFFLRNPYNSFVLVNKEGCIEFMDRGSEKFFGLSDGGAKGVKVTDLIENSLLPAVLESQAPITGKVIDVNNQRRIASAYQIMQNGELIGAIGRVIFRSLDEVNRLDRQVRNLKKKVKSLEERQEHSAIYTFEDILGVSANIKECIELAKKAAVTGTDVLVVGESGTGKELFAQSIHNFNQPDRPFVSINSPAIPFDLAESELFGYRKGAFSGAASEGKLGKFEIANNGTLFLDEIAALPLSIQAKLLRVLEEREVQALGDTRSKKVKFHLISATNVDLKKLVDEGKFRMDLYYRLAKITIAIDPLRKRKEDIPIFVDHFLKAINRRYGSNFKRISDDVLSCFMRYDWFGNVRELINVLEQSCLKKWQGKEITVHCLPPELSGLQSERSSVQLMSFKNKKSDTEKKLILQALEKTNGNKRQAAMMLGMPRSTFYKKIREYNIET